MELFLYFFRKYPWRTIIVFIGVTIASVITAITLLALPAILAGMLGRSTGKAEFLNEFLELAGINPTTENLLIFFISGIIIQNLLLASAKIYAGFTVAKIIKDLRIKMLNSMSQTEWKYFMSQSSGKFTSSLINDIDKAGNGYRKIVEILAILVQIIAYLSVAFFISWPIAVIAIITSVILAILFSRLIKISKSLGAADSNLVNKITDQLFDFYQSIKALKAMARENHTSAVLNNITKELKSVSRKSTVVSETLTMAQEIILMSVIVLTVYFAFSSLDIPIELAIVLVILYLRSMRLFGKAQKNYQTFVSNVNGFNKIRRIIDKSTKWKEMRSGTKKVTINDDIKIVNISFSHGVSLNHDKQPILQNANAVIQHKKLNSIIGLSGEGKSTLIDLICGLYLPNSGSIYINDTPLTEIDISYWRKQIGYVAQETHLLNTSVRENVILGDPKVSETEIYDALEKAHAISFVDQLPEKLDAQVGERGGRLSGGQRQRILIARALVHSPKLLILDEATSSLDSETEQTLSRVFKELSNQMTVISISHRPAMIDASDHVIKVSNHTLISNPNL